MKPLVILFWVAALALAATPSAASSAKNCGSVTYTYPHGEGGSGAGKIKATNIGCSSARKVVRTCLTGKKPSGWKIRHTKGFVLIRLTKGDMKIEYQPAGGAGCES